MLNYIKNIYNPEKFHSKNLNKDNYFEGWYFKIVDHNQNNTYAIIPGIFLNKEGNSSHSFIQILDPNKGKAHYLKYVLEQFSSSEEKFQIKIKNNIFTKEKIKLDIENENIIMKGKLKFKNIFSWPVKLLSPGAMGWYGFLPFMECNHGVLSFNHKIEGVLKINNKRIDFTDGKGYIEKDWGTNFPSAWLWLQTNHFNDYSSSLMVSIATIPWLKNEFRGFIIGFYFQEELYKFTTYNNSKIIGFKKEDNSIEIEVVNKNHKLIIKADYNQGELLKGPFRNEMIKNVEESLDAKVEVALINLNDNKVITKDIGENTGFELNGSISDIIDEFV